ncbi:MAG: hypothetical protein DSY38_04225 [Fusobacteria bacterium]|nr:MAG: hypothetical protein DSY38_04225 [Fusobacteriota bacterium]
MKLKHLYILIIYSLIVFTINSPEALANSVGISQIDSEIQLKKEQLKELENLKRSILKAKLSGKHLKVGVALSGGGAKGFAHIGVLKVLEENNIPIDYISGTSMGAIVASLYATGYSPDEIEVVVKTMDWNYRLANEPLRKYVPLSEKYNSQKYFASITYDNRLNISLPKGVLTGEKSYLKLKELFWNVQNVKSFDEFSPVLRIVATDFNTGEAKTFDSGDLAKIVSASMAIPTVYDPVKIGDNVYVDGMVSRNLPVEDLFKAGADIVIASDVGAPLVRDLNYNILTVVTKISSYRGVESTEKQRELATIIIDPNVKLENASDFTHFDSFISEGKIATEIKIKDIEKYDIRKEEKRTINRLPPHDVYIDKIKVINAKNMNETVVKENLTKNIPNNFSYSELEDLMMKLYALSYVEKSYYHIEGSTLVVDVEEKDPNHIRVGMNYNSDIGAKLAIMTDLTKIGKFIGRTTTAEIELGEYRSLEFNNFWYYGKNNKVGFDFKLGYEELPIFIYRESLFGFSNFY